MSLRLVETMDRTLGILLDFLPPKKYSDSAAVLFLRFVFEITYIQHFLVNAWPWNTSRLASLGKTPRAVDTHYEYR